MNIEKEIYNRMQNGYTELEAIAILNLGQRSEAAKRVIEKRAKRVKYLKCGIPFTVACQVVNIEYKFH